jgi:hypothetical protein
MPLPDEDLLDKHFPDDDRGRPHGAKKALGIFAVVVTSLLLVGMVFFYFAGEKMPDPENLPTIAENNPPEHLKPEDPGGMEIPHQDTTVYNQVGAQQMVEAPEKLLPEAEAPIAADAANTVTNPVGTEISDAVPEKIIPETQTADIPTSLETLPGVPADAPTAMAAENHVRDLPKAAVSNEAATVTAQPETPKPEAPSVVAAASEGYRIQLGAVRTEELAKSEWARMQNRHAEALKGLEPYYSNVNLGDKGDYLRIQTTALQREDADARCEKLKAANQACLVVRAVQ